jgi:hypothetical protein
MWLQTSTNALFECGLRNNMLSLMFLKNVNAQIAIKVNNKLTRRIDVQNVEMQGTVWSSLKCTSSMDRLNKTVLSNSELQYYYKGDMNIPIGVRGMVDDTLGISKCGASAVKLNSTINSFIEAQRQALSEKKKCCCPCGEQDQM